RMSRSVLFTAAGVTQADEAARLVQEKFDQLAQVVSATSRFAQLLEAHPEVVGNLLFVRFAFSTGDASGHNMATAAAEGLMGEVLAWARGLAAGSVAGNFCPDTNATAVDGIRGGGRNVVV